MNNQIENFPKSLNALQMLTSIDVSNIFHVHENQVNIWRETGILKGIRTGKSYMYSQKEILEFQERFNGLDVSNKVRIKESLEKLKFKEIVHRE